MMRVRLPQAPGLCWEEPPCRSAGPERPRLATACPGPVNPRLRHGSQHPDEDTEAPRGAGLAHGLAAREGRAGF